MSERGRRWYSLSIYSGVLIFLSFILAEEGEGHLLFVNIVVFVCGHYFHDSCLGGEVRSTALKQDFLCSPNFRDMGLKHLRPKITQRW